MIDNTNQQLYRKDAAALKKRKCLTMPIRAGLIGAISLLLSACAAEVQRMPSAELVMTAGPKSIRLTSDVEVILNTNYTRTLKRDSKWSLVGSIAQGEVLKPEGGILTVEGANVHEAYIVVARGRLVGFYLPVERAFVPLASQPVLPVDQ